VATSSGKTPENRIEKKLLKAAGIRDTDDLASCQDISGVNV
jgi:hypothetical protein